MYYYTYAYLREDKTPYYIGKGKGNRAYRRRKTDIKPPKDKSRIIFLKQNLTEKEAFKHEIYMIAVLGRKDLGTGLLYNRTDGGEGISGLIHSEKTKRKMSEARKGTPLSEEHKIKLSKVKKNVYIPWNKGKKTSSQNASKKYKITFNTGKEITINNLSKWCKDNKYSRTELCMKGKSKDIVAVIKVAQDT